MNQHMIRLKAKPSILALIFLFVAFNSAATAHAVIPQLLGPLSALLSIIPQLLAIIGVAFLTTFVFARDWLKGLFYRIRESVLLKTITLILLLAILGAGVWVIYGGLQSGQPYATTTQFGLRNSLRNSLGPPFGEELRVPDNSTISPDQRTPQSHGCSKGQAALS